MSLSNEIYDTLTHRGGLKYAEGIYYSGDNISLSAVAFDIKPIRIKYKHFLDLNLDSENNPIVQYDEGYILSTLVMDVAYFTNHAYTKSLLKHGIFVWQLRNEDVRKLREMINNKDVKLKELWYLHSFLEQDNMVISCFEFNGEKYINCGYSNIYYKANSVEDFILTLLNEIDKYDNVVEVKLNARHHCMDVISLAEHVTDSQIRLDYEKYYYWYKPVYSLKESFYVENVIIYFDQLFDTIVGISKIPI